jgi:group I intron endonuclease
MQIYKTVNLINGKFYIGQTSLKGDRLKKYYGSSRKLQEDIKKYGKENFIKEILEDNIQTKDELDIQEQYWIQKLNARDSELGYNKAPGGTGGDTGYRFVDNPNKEQIRKKLSKLHKERCADLKIRNQMSIYQRNHYKKHPERKKKLSKSQKETWLIPGQKDRLLGKNNPNWQGYVYIYNFKGELELKYESSCEAANKLSMDRSHIHAFSKRSKPISRGKYKGYKFIISKDILK